MRISLSMIVKDEIQNLSDCVKSVSDIVDEVVIVDTGSTDGTWPLVQSLADVHSQIPWPNHFGQARNVSLGLSGGDWVLILDGDEKLAEGHEVIVEAVKDPNLLAAELKITSHLGDGKSGDIWALRLFRRHPSISWTGRIHEQVLPSIQAVIQADPRWRVRRLSACIEHGGYLPEVMEAKQKKARNIDLLQAALDELGPQASVVKRAYLEYKISAEKGRAGKANLFNAAELVMGAQNSVRREFALSAEVLVSASQQWCLDGDGTKALEASDVALTLRPGNGMVSLVRAQALFLLEQVEAAEKEAINAKRWRLNPSDFYFDQQAHDIALSILEAKILGRQGRLPEQQEIFDSLHGRYPGNGFIALERVHLLNETGRSKEALREGLAHLKQYGTSAGALLACADAAASIGMNDKAREWRVLAGKVRGDL